MDEQPQEKKPQEKTFNEKVKTADVPQLNRMMRLLNFLNASFLVTAGVLAFVLKVGGLSLPVILSAVYVIAFALLLICFETHFGFVERIVYRDCGFMFRWQGRCLFLIFTGTLAFGLGIIGIIAGACTVVNVIFNLYVLKTNRSYEQYLAKQGVEERVRSRSTDNLKKAVVTSAVNSAVTTASPSSGDSSAGSGGATAPAGWEKILDEESGTYYYYNNATKETRWDVPT